MPIFQNLGLVELPSGARTRPSGRKRHRRVAFATVASSLATSALMLLSAPLPASAQSASVEDDVKGTACESPKDENTQSACAAAVLECAFVTVYGRTNEEKDRLYRGCIRKIVARYRQASDATGDAVRREFSDSPADRAAAKAAEKRKAQEQAAAAALQAKQQKEFQQSAQQRVDTVRQACMTGRGTLDVVGTTFVDGAKFGVMDVWAYGGQVVQPVADPDAVAVGKCSVQFTQGNRNIVGRIAMGGLKPSATLPAQAGN